MSQTLLGWGLTPGAGIADSQALKASKGLVCSQRGEEHTLLSPCWWGVMWDAEGGGCSQVVRGISSQVKELGLGEPLAYRTGPGQICASDRSCWNL